uniref:Transcription factor HIVEP2-like n=1 Tax=Poecilia latipinna TaxID=48699 RepID=A0A3B3UG77_9TELE
MRRSSSEQAPCNLHKEFPEVRSISFDYGSLSPTSKVRHVDINVVKERRRGNLVRQDADNRFALPTEPREKSVDEDSLSMLPLDQTSLLFDPYSSYLLSPGWESPIREPSPSRLRYPSPRRELSPRGRPGSPIFKSIQHPCPRVVLRAVSPRRGSHQHKGGCDKTRHQTFMHLLWGDYADQRSGGLAPAQPPGAASSHHQNVLSHLPLHSQQQPRSLLPVVPVGGLQMLHSPASPSADVVGPSPASSPRSCSSSSSREGSVHGPETGGDNVNGRQGKSPELPAGESRQEESVQTCLKAICSWGAAQNQSKGHNWPPGRTLDIPGLHEVRRPLYIFNLHAVEEFFSQTSQSEMDRLSFHLSAAPSLHTFKAHLSK